MYKLSEVIAIIQENQVFKAYFADTYWYITKSVDFIRYCNKDGIPYDTILLTPSNLRAKYEFIK